MCLSGKITVKVAERKTRDSLQVRLLSAEAVVNLFWLANGDKSHHSIERI